MQETILMPTPGTGRDLDYEMRTSKMIAPAPPAGAGRDLEYEARGMKTLAPTPAMDLPVKGVEVTQNVFNKGVGLASGLVNRGFDLLKNPAVLAVLGLGTLFIYRKPIMKSVKKVVA